MRRAPSSRSDPDDVGVFAIGGPLDPDPVSGHVLEHAEDGGTTWSVATLPAGLSQVLDVDATP